MRIEPIRSSVSIVLVGDFNPSIFHPEWFVRNSILSKSDCESCEIELIHKEVAIFKIADWLRLTVDRGRFSVQTTEPPFIRIFDFVYKTFGEALVHTPISQMGINREVHFSVGEEEVRNRIGKVLAPHEPWGEWAPFIEGNRPGKRGGMNVISMRQLDLADRDDGVLDVHVGPSSVTSDNTGIYVLVNDHYQIPETENEFGIPQALTILANQFEVSISKSEWIIDQIMALKGRV